MLVRHQPTAVDHRLLMAVMKITNDLERMGDSARNIARSVVALTEEPPLKPYIDLPRTEASRLKPPGPCQVSMSSTVC